MANESIEARIAPATALMELTLALIGHLHDRGLVEKAELIRLLENRMPAIRQNDPSGGMEKLVSAEIDWLARLGTADPIEPPRLLH